jgi:hypothetical protein
VRRICESYKTWMSFLWTISELNLVSWCSSTQICTIMCVPHQTQNIMGRSKANNPSTLPHIATLADAGLVGVTMMFIFEHYANKHISCPYQTSKPNHRLYKLESSKFWWTTNALFVNKCSTPWTGIFFGEDPLEPYKLVIGKTWKSPKKTL